MSEVDWRMELAQELAISAPMLQGLSGRIANQFSWFELQSQAIQKALVSSLIKTNSAAKLCDVAPICVPLEAHFPAVSILA